jgi:hypothetical protein
MVRAFGPRMAMATARQISPSKVRRAPWSSVEEYSGVSWLMPQRRVRVWRMRASVEAWTEGAARRRRRRIGWSGE